MNIYQWILIIIAVGYMADRIRRFVRRERYQSFIKLVATLIIWGSILYIALFPHEWRLLVRRLGLGQDTDMIILIAFIVVFLILFRIISIMEKIERNITVLVRREALQDLKENS